MVEGRGQRTQTAATEAFNLNASQSSAVSAPATASSSAQAFPFDFFESTRCISGDVRLIADPAQPGTTVSYWSHDYIFCTQGLSYCKILFHMMTVSCAPAG